MPREQVGRLADGDAAGKPADPSVPQPQPLVAHPSVFVRHTPWQSHPPPYSPTHPHPSAYPSIQPPNHQPIDAGYPLTTLGCFDLTATLCPSRIDPRTKHHDGMPLPVQHGAMACRCLCNMAPWHAAACATRQDVSLCPHGGSMVPFRLAGSMSHEIQFN